MRLISKIDLKSDIFIKSIQMEGLRRLGDPKITIENYYKKGISELIILDCSASWFGQDISPDVIRRITEKIYIPKTVGGGINTLEDCEKFFDSGADKIVINTGVINKPDLIDKIAKKYGSQSITVSLEYKFIQNKFELFKCFGREKTNLNLSQWIDEITSRGAGELFFCCIEKDGTGTGFDENILKFLQVNKINVPVIVSSGFGKLEHLDLIKKYKGYVQGICISKSFHYNEIEIKTVKNYIDKLFL